MLPLEPLVHIRLWKAAQEEQAGNPTYYPALTRDQVAATVPPDPPKDQLNTVTARQICLSSKSREKKDLVPVIKLAGNCAACSIA